MSSSGRLSTNLKSALLNILITCIGRRNYMVDFFRKALAPYGGRVFAMNSHADSPGGLASDLFVVSPPIGSPNHGPFLLDFCREHRVRAVVPMIDQELPSLARLRRSFKEEGIEILVAEEWVVDMAIDKWKTRLFLMGEGFPVVPAYLGLEEALAALEAGTMRLPAYVKHRYGHGSQIVYKAEDTEELRFFHRLATRQALGANGWMGSVPIESPSVFIEQALPGREYNLDVMNDLQGGHVSTCVKEKTVLRSGETDVAQVVDVPALEKVGQRLAGHLRHPGNLDVDLFWDGEKAYVMDVNPRFGGGYPISHEAGADLARAIVKWLAGDEVDPSELKARPGTRVMKGISLWSIGG